MGNIIQALSGKNNKKNSDDNQRLQLFKADLVCTMFLKFVENLKNQVQLFRIRAKHDYTNVLKYVEKVEQHVLQFYDRYVFLLYGKYVKSLPLEPPEQRNGRKSLVLYQVYALGGLFALKWAWKRWIQPKEDNPSDDPS